MTRPLRQVGGIDYEGLLVFLECSPIHRFGKTMKDHEL